MICERCGKEIDHGRFCDKCSEEITAPSGVGKTLGFLMLLPFLMYYVWRMTEAICNALF